MKYLDLAEKGKVSGPHAGDSRDDESGQGEECGEGGGD